MTPAIRAAQRAGVPHEVLEYTHDPSAESYGLEAAAALGIAPERVFKTLVVQTDAGRLAVALVPVSASLDLKAMAGALGGEARRNGRSGRCRARDLSGVARPDRAMKRFHPHG